MDTRIVKTYACKKATPISNNKTAEIRKTRTKKNQNFIEITLTIKLEII
jgi:hypothetical protein